MEQWEDPDALTYFGQPSSDIDKNWHQLFERESHASLSYPSKILKSTSKIRTSACLPPSCKVLVERKREFASLMELTMARLWFSIISIVWYVLTFSSGSQKTYKRSEKHSTCAAPRALWVEQSSGLGAGNASRTYRPLSPYADGSHYVSS
jgi:hypothetical protein